VGGGSLSSFHLECAFCSAADTRRSCEFLAMFQGQQASLNVQIVAGMTPCSRGKLPMPETPQDCPAEIWHLVQQCLLLKPEERPSAKEVSCRQ
jgi:hypothetical protein